MAAVLAFLRKTYCIHCYEAWAAAPLGSGPAVASENALAARDRLHLLVFHDSVLAAVAAAVAEAWDRNDFASCLAARVLQRHFDAAHIDSLERRIVAVRAAETAVLCRHRLHDDHPAEAEDKASADNDAADKEDAADPDTAPALAANKYLASGHSQLEHTAVARVSTILGETAEHDDRTMQD